MHIAPVHDTPISRPVTGAGGRGLPVARGPPRASPVPVAAGVPAAGGRHGPRGAEQDAAPPMITMAPAATRSIPAQVAFRTSVAVLPHVHGAVEVDPQVVGRTAAVHVGELDPARAARIHPARALNAGRDHAHRLPVDPAAGHASVVPRLHGTARLHEQVLSPTAPPPL